MKAKRDRNKSRGTAVDEMCGRGGRKWGTQH